MSSEAEAARVRYIAEHAHYQAAAGTVAPLVSALLASCGLSHLHFKARAKEIGSFVKKLRNYEVDCWNKTTDKVGVQITTETLGQLRRLRTALEASAPGLLYIATTDKLSSSDPRSLHYSGVHVQVTVEGVATSTGEPIECEVQLRTQSQDIWASLEHRLIYKPVIEPSRTVARKIARLSVLVEMFDEEVDHAMTEVENDPRYENALLLRAAEGLYHSFVTEPGEDDLSFEVLDIIGDAFAADERAGYSDTLSTFVADHRDQLSDKIEQFGIHSGFAGQFAYVLFSQPESLILFERITNRRMLLAEAVAGTEIADAVSILAEAWGTTLW